MVKHQRSQMSSLFGWNLSGALDRSLRHPPKKGVVGIVLVLGSRSSESMLKDYLPDGIPSWQKPQSKKQTLFSGYYARGELLILRLKSLKPMDQDFGLHEQSAYSLARQQVGTLTSKMESMLTRHWQVTYIGDDDEEALGLLVGIGLSDYSYLSSIGSSGKAGLQYILSGFDRSLIDRAKALSLGTNIARHLVNTPANKLNPETYAKEIRNLFGSFQGTTVEVWHEARLKKEKMELMLAVGQASATSSKMVRIRYRPKGVKGQPIAFVGKGITFDSGGLDLKPPASMRLMKKDMGGSASVVGLAHWAISSKVKLNLDFYCALAENAVNEHAFRPGDVLTARNGLRVEIHNTDAEGRLVLADTLDVAVKESGKNAPRMVIDVATLTGAARGAVGTSIGALFSTKTSFGERVARSGQERGDHVWPLPLYSPYASKLKSSFGDINHCAAGGYGGAITAALFLKMFVGDVPWVHLDIMAWSEKGGVFKEAGGNGQMVQCLAAFLEAEEKKES